ncbi:RsmD family RNA methyltransferase [Patiriisocius sp. Uisw_017]|jgi:16S rRNA (guanine(966)-N(2))-methyltransferase RsmD|uniref:RsmD family RNA methyltransferase n=1 Tax=Patiriisocius sp. Uisw_017 TaxID=3230968 RepID=UPI0039EA4A84
MRIISGIYKGKRLTAPKSLPVRPTTDFAKEALFNILNHRVDFEAIKLLDLFAGTGNISYEFASRGCKSITAVDSHYGCIKYISQIAEELDFSINPVKADVFKYCGSNREGFDIIFADPPYAFELDKMEELIKSCFENDFVLEDGTIIIEHTKHLDLSSITNYTESRRYGGSVFSFFNKS